MVSSPFGATVALPPELTELFVIGINFHIGADPVMLDEHVHKILAVVKVIDGLLPLTSAPTLTSTES